MTINAGEFLIAFVAAMGIPSAIMGFIVWKLERKIAARDKRAEEQEEAQKDFFLLMCRVQAQQSRSAKQPPRRYSAFQTRTATAICTML